MSAPSVLCTMFTVVPMAAHATSACRCQVPLLAAVPDVVVAADMHKEDPAVAEATLNFVSNMSYRGAARVRPSFVCLIVCLGRP
jgi:hypothetical protein